MLLSYLKIALRNLARQKMFSIINAFGLAMGMSVSLLLISFYSFVSSFDDFHSNADRIYRIISTSENGMELKRKASAPLVLGNRIGEELHEIEEVVRINSTFRGNVVTDNGNIPVHGLYTDTSFLSVFDFGLIQGNARLALAKPNSIVLTESVALKLAGSTDMLGKSIDIEGLGQFQVTGIVKDQKRTHLWFEALVSMNTLPTLAHDDERDAAQWTSYQDQYVYILLDHPDHAGNITHWLDHVSQEKYKQTSSKVTFQLQALHDITPGPDLDNAIGPDSDYTLIIVFATISLLILVPACFNYINLSIARALKRSREIGVRKTMGGVRKQLFFQFVGETITMTLISLLCAVLIFFLIRPEFEDMMPGAWLDLSLTWEMVAAFIVFAIVTGTIAGIFPALYFSALNPIQALKGKIVERSRSRMFARKTLVIVQFAISFSFIVLLILFGRQYRYNLNYNYGFNTANILDVHLKEADPAIFKAEFSRLAEVQQISMSSDVLGTSFSSVVVRQPHRDDSLEAAQLFADAQYIGNMELTLLAGRNFNSTIHHDTEMIVNEEFLRVWNIATPVDAIGMTFHIDDKSLEIVGVLKNFHFESLLVPMKAFLLRSDPSRFAYANIKVASPDMTTTIGKMENTWSRLAATKFEAHFFDDELEILYHFYWALLQMIGYLGLLAMSISILGLLGMVVYTTENRIKEVGIRKVFGASDSGIVYLLSKDFLVLMLIAVVIALPLCHYLFGEILSLMQYYHVTFGIWDILIGLFVFFIAGATTIVSHTLRAARQNPVITLKYE